MKTVSGEIWHEGWDIPTRWSRDEAGQLYANDAHGGAGRPVELEQLLSRCDSPQQRQNIEAALGLPLTPTPEQALRAENARLRESHARLLAVVRLVLSETDEDENGDMPDSPRAALFTLRNAAEAAIDVNLP